MTWQTLGRAQCMERAACDEIQIALIHVGIGIRLLRGITHT